VHRIRALLVRPRTMAANALRAAFAEFGVVAPPGVKGGRELMAPLPAPAAIPEPAQAALASLARPWPALDADVAALERASVGTTRSEPAARRLMAIPGIGPSVASAVLATVPDAKVFHAGRGFAAWLGLTPRPNNSAGKRRSGGIAKPGQRRLRPLLILGASAHRRPERVRPRDPWRAGLLARRPVEVAAVARAAKTARIVWALLAKDQDDRAPGAQAARGHSTRTRALAP
jgi:transposase